MGAKKLNGLESMKLYTIKQAADILSYHEKTIAKFVQRGEIESVKIKGKRLISENHILRFLKKNMIDGSI